MYSVMTLPVGPGRSRQYATTLTDDDADDLDYLAESLGETRAAVMRMFVRMGIDLMLDPVAAVPRMLEGLEANLARANAELAALEGDAGCR